MKYDVFISYSRQDYIDRNQEVIDGNVITQIKELFNQNGITYWFDEDGVYSGDAFAPVIARNIKSSKIFLFISSENSNASEWTSNEIATAHTYKKKIIPFKYDDSVYNDSVIIYIARLDYIDYNSNPTKSLLRLLDSVKTYLKEEIEREERYRQEEELRRNAEISRQERAEKLQNIRERIDNLENRRLQIEQDILSQEKVLTDLRNEKRIVETNISDLQDEEAVLLGHNKIKIKEKDIKPKAEAVNVKIQNPSKKGFWEREWAELKSEMALKHWILNTILIFAFVLSLCLLPFCFEGIYYWKPEEQFLLFAFFCTCIGLYNILKNYRNGFIWLCFAVVWLVLFSFAWDFRPFIIVFLCFILFFVSMMFISKNGCPAYSVVKKRTSFVKNVSFVIYSIMLSLFVWNWIDKDVEIRRYVRVIENATSIKKVQQLWDNAYLVGGCHPFKSIYDYRYVYEGKLAELKKAEKEAESKAAAEAEIANTSQPQEKHPNPKRNIPTPRETSQFQNQNQSPNKNNY